MMFRPRQSRPRFRCGFTLIETAITTVIVGLGTAGMMGLLAVGSYSNQQTAILTTAVNLADNIHELSDQTIYPTSGAWGMPTGQTISSIFTTGNVSWLSGQTFNPPIDATTTNISGMGNWTQSVTVNNVSPTNLTTTITPNAYTNPMSLVTVTISYKGEQVYQNSWMTAAQ